MLARAENDFDFFSRRAMEEARAAALAKSAAASAAHRHMAAAYASLLRDDRHAVVSIADAGTVPDQDDDMDGDVGDEDPVRQD